MLDPEFIEWLREGTREEISVKNRKFLAYLREHPEIYAGDPKRLDEFEASLDKCDAAEERLRRAEREKAEIEEQLLRSDAAYDESATQKRNPLLIPMFGKPKKDSH